MSTGPLQLEVNVTADDARKWIEEHLPIFKQIGEERVRQIEKGYNKGLDDEKNGMNWAHLVQREAHYAAQAAHGDEDAHGFRQRMIRVLAVAWAAVEAYDRVNTPSDLDINPEPSDE